jgi:hypothetical protein
MPLVVKRREPAAVPLHRRYQFVYRRPVTAQDCILQFLLAVAELRDHLSLSGHGGSYLSQFHRILPSMATRLDCRPVQLRR